MRRRIHILHCYVPRALASPLYSLLPIFSFSASSHRRLRRRTSDDGTGDENSAGGGGRFQLYKSRGQHLLTNPRVLDSIVRHAGVRPTDTVLEIGPGTGNLTVRLLQAAANVVAVEIDRRMVDALTARVEQLGLTDRLTVITENALKADFENFNVCVANIPYGISSPLIAKLLFGPSRTSLRSATLLLQKEFARRLLALPGDSEFNRLAANVGLVATVKFLMDVSKRDFVPCPKVDSSLVKIQPRSEIPAIDLDEWLAFTRTCFSKKNKTLGAIFKQKKNTSELFRRFKLKCQERKITSGLIEDLDDICADKEDQDGDDSAGDRGDTSELRLFKEKIVGLLKVEGYEEKRPSKLSNVELLHLLQLFNQEGILFRSKCAEADLCIGS